MSGRLLEHWQAPAGAGAPIGLVTTTFTLDVEFFETSCLSRFLALDSQPGESDGLMALIEEEERLAEVRVSLLVDRSERPGSRKLRWDLIAAVNPSGLQHAKATVLVWERHVRVLVASANLTPAGYRSNVEVLTAFDAFDGSAAPRQVVIDVIAFVREQIEAACTGRLDESGPGARALATLAEATRLIDGWSTSPGWPKPLRVAVAPGGPHRSPLGALTRVWGGGMEPRDAVVLSPYYDSAPGDVAAAQALLERLARRGRRSIRFVLPGDATAAGLVVRAPATVASGLPDGLASFELFRPPDDEPRRLHAKVLVVRSDAWVAAMVGSSNFTSAGLGVHGARGHIELNVWFGAPADSLEGKHLLALVPTGQPFTAENATWQPDEDDETPLLPVLPYGFVDCLLAPDREHPTLRLVLAAESLPAWWRVRAGSGDVLDSVAWSAAGRPVEHIVPLPPGPPPFFVEIDWRDGDGTTWSAPFAVNVTDPGALPPPDELRGLPADAVLAALASSRPLHEAVMAEMTRRARTEAAGLTELDPLKRHGTDGLLRRTRRLSSALAGLQDRLARPVRTTDALAWRLEGPFGPRSIAERLLAEHDAEGRLPGEASFCVAELALAVGRVDWAAAATTAVSEAQLRAAAQRSVAELRTMVAIDQVPVHLAGYIRDAFDEATR